MKKRGTQSQIMTLRLSTGTEIIELMEMSNHQLPMQTPHHHKNLVKEKIL